MSVRAIRMPVDLIKEIFKDGTRAQLEGEVFVVVPDRVTLVGQGLIFERPNWIYSLKCPRCASGESCHQLVGVYEGCATAAVAHEYDRSAAVGQKPWPAYDPTLDEDPQVRLR